MKHSVFKQTACFIVFFTMMILIFYWICSVVITMPEAEPMTAVTKHVYVKNSDGNQAVGQTKSIINDDKEHAVSIHYPITGISEIDRVIEQEVYNKIEEFENKKIGYQALEPDVSSSIWIDYESYIKGDIISVVFYTEENFSALAHPLECVDTLVFEITSAKQLSLGDIFKSDDFSILAELTKEQFAENLDVKSQMDTELFLNGTEPTEQNYQHFALKEDGLAVYFEKYQILSGYFGIQSVTIPYDSLSGHLNIDLSNAAPEAVQTTALPKGELTEPQTAIIDKQKPMVALTFDDGPHYTVTPRILDILQEHNARATFFVLGNRVDNFPNIIQREYSQGHEIGSHSFSHPQITTLTSDEIEYQFAETEHRIQQYVPYTTKLVRPPYGQITQSLKEVLQKTFVLWSIDTQDWKTRDKDAIVSEVLNNVKDGDIILMHDMYSTTADACEELIPALIERGYQLVTVSELLNAKEITPVAGSVYSRVLSTENVAS